LFGTQQLFFGDNGPQPGQTGKDFNGAWPYKGFKTQLWEVGGKMAIA
jgi:hypothetical protein